METERTPKEWLQAAIDALSLAACLTDPAAKRIMEEAADQCERLAQLAEARAATPRTDAEAHGH